MSAHDRSPDGYRVTLECGHHIEMDRAPRRREVLGLCDVCQRPSHILDYTPLYVWWSEPPATPALRSRWVRVLSRVPGLSRLVDAISGPWTGGDDG